MPNNLELHRELIINMYVNETRSSKDIAEHLKALQCDVSQIHVIKFLQANDVKMHDRSFRAKIARQENPRQYELTCCGCDQHFLSKSLTRSCCYSCVPDTRAKQRYELYGLTQTRYEKMLAEQDNKCAICKTSFATLSSRSVHVDHDHKTGKVRGVLCSMCNSGLSYLDKLNWIDAAQSYLISSSRA